MRVRMVQCIGREVEMPPRMDATKWADSGGSVRPVQEHLGDEGSVLWEDSDGIVIRFDDGDERKLFLEEIERI